MVASGYKYIHYDLTNVIGYMTIGLIVDSNFVTTFPLWLNVGFFVRIIESFNNIIKNLRRGIGNLSQELGLLLLLNPLICFDCLCVLSLFIPL